VDILNIYRSDLFTVSLALSRNTTEFLDGLKIDGRGRKIFKTLFSEWRLTQVGAADMDTVGNFCDFL